MGSIKILHKVVASSLVETLVSTTIILIVFSISVFTIINLLERKVRTSRFSIDQEINKQIYLYEHDQITIPYKVENKDWNIKAYKVKENKDSILKIELSNRYLDEVIFKKIFK